jgi:pimeloyl-ACP methyl ester carboxylesterase
LSTAGQHVLRFDYRGTGDSSGDIADSTVTDWVDDIVAATNEGVDITGAGRVNLVGVRLGGLLLCRALPRIDAIAKVVLWDAVRDGAEYLDTLRAISMQLVNRNPWLRGAARAAATNDYGGQGIGEPMVEELRALQSDVFGNLTGNAYEVIATDDRYAPPQDVANVTQVPFPCNWGTDSEALLMPQPVLERIRESLVSR